MRTRAHNARVAGSLQVTATISRAHFPCAFTFPQVGRARSVRIPVRICARAGKEGSWRARSRPWSLEDNTFGAHVLRENTAGDAVADQLALTSLNVDPVGDTAGRPTLAEAPELALALDPAVAPSVTGVGPDQGLRTYYVMLDNITGEVDVVRDER